MVVRELLAKTAAYFSAYAMPAAVVIHDKRVHDAREKAQFAQVELERAVRMSRRALSRTSSPEEIERQVVEMTKAKTRIDQIVKTHDEDPDSDILRAMDAP
jgi:hypothetical protein